MAFVRYKIVQGKRYYQVVCNYRQDGKHKQEVLCHLGEYRDLQTAIEEETMIVEHAYGDVEYCLEQLRYAAKSIQEVYGDEFGDRVPTLEEAEAKRETIFDEYDDSFSDEQAERWREQLQAVNELLHQIYNYIDAEWEAHGYRNLANEHQAKLDKFRAVRQRYF